MRFKGGVSRRMLFFLIGLSAAPLIVLAYLHFTMSEFAAGFLYGFFGAGLFIVTLFMYKAKEGNVADEVREES